MRASVGRVGFAAVAAAWGALASQTACGRGARTTPVTPPSGAGAAAAPTTPPRLREPPRLAWMATWDGGSPTLLASPGGRLAIAVLGTATLGDAKIGADGPLCLWLIPLGPDRRPGPATCIGPSLAWAHPLALLDDGGLVIEGQKPRAATAELMRARGDGSIAWAQPVPADHFVAAAAVAATGDTIGVVLGNGHRALRILNGRQDVGIAGGLGPQQSGEIRGYDGAGRLRFASSLKSGQGVSCGHLAVGPRGVLIAGGHFTQNLRIDRAGGPPAIVQSPYTAAWVAAWDAGGRVSWLRKLTATGKNGWIQRVDALADGTVRAMGLASGRLTDVGNAVVVDQDVPDAGAAAPDAGGRAAPKPDPNRQTTFVVRLDGATGVSQAVGYLPHARTMVGWGDDLIDVDTSRPRDDENVNVTALRAAGGVGQTWWRTDLDANLDAVAAAPDAVLVWGSYDVVMTLPGREPPALAIGIGANSQFVGLLSWTAGAGAAPEIMSPAPPSQARFADLHARATRAFRAKRYREACDLFADAQRARPTDAANMADLALCLQRVDDRDGAARANRYAIRLASVPGAADDAKKLRIRKAAYYNLGNLKDGGPFSGLVPEFGCEKRVYADYRTGTTGGMRYLVDYEIARFALRDDTATFEEDEYRSDWPELGASDGATSDGAGETSYDVTLSVNQDFRNDQGESQEVQSGGCTLIFADGCSGHLGFDCSFDDERHGKKSTSRVIELTLARETPDAGD